MRFLSVFSLALFGALLATSNASAVPVYSLAAQRTTLDLDLGGDATITAFFSFADSEAEVHNLGVDDSASVPLDVRQAAVGFVPGAAGVHGAAPGENTYFRSPVVPTSAANWDPGGAGGAVNPGDDRARADAVISAPGGLDTSILAGTLVAENITEAVVNSFYQTVEDAGGIGDWELTYQITTAGVGGDFLLTADFVNELIAHTGGPFIGPPEGDFAFAEVAFQASLFSNTAGSAVDINGGAAGTTFTPAEGNILISQFGPGRTALGPTVQAPAVSGGGAAVALAANSVFTLSIAGSEFSQVVPNPEPSTYALMVLAGSGLFVYGRRRRRNESDNSDN